jgi:hypothetical protein
MLELAEYRVSASLAAYRTDTADILARVQYDKAGTGDGHASAIEHAYKQVAEDLATGALRELLNAWYFRFQHGDSVDLTLVIVARTEDDLRQAQRYAMRFYDVLASIDGVTEVREEDYSRQAEKAFQRYTVETTLDTTLLKKKLLFSDIRGAGFSLEVTGTTAKTLEVTIRID